MDQSNASHLLPPSYPPSDQIVKGQQVDKGQRPAAIKGGWWVAGKRESGSTWLGTTVLLFLISYKRYDFSLQQLPSVVPWFFILNKR